MLESSSKQLQQQVFLALVSRVVVQRQYRRLHELGRAARRQCKHQPRQVDGARLQQVEQVLVGLQAVTVSLAQRLEADGR